MFRYSAAGSLTLLSLLTLGPTLHAHQSASSGMIGIVRLDGRRAPRCDRDGHGHGHGDKCQTRYRHR